MPADVKGIDVAEYILSQRGVMTAMKLQKLAYYSQVWSMVWNDQALFDEDFQAWANGPVLPALYSVHRGNFQVQSVGGNSGQLIQQMKRTIDSVLEFYGHHSAQWLSDLTHMEAPWQKAREGVPPMERSTNVISKESIMEYYSSL